MNNQAFYFLLLVLLVLGCGNLNAQGTKADTLYSEIEHMDSLVFTAFNNRDIKTFENLFTVDLEFYHDKSGLTDYTYTIQSLQNASTRNDGLRRELIPGSLEIYPIPNYGAMEIGVHRFCHQENGKQECGIFKFVHIWKKTGNEWKIMRVVSYGH